MRRLGTLLGVFAATFLGAPGAQAQSQAPDGAKQLVIHSSSDAAGAYRAFARFLVAEGFELQSSDPTLLLIQTKYRDTKSMGSSGRIKLSAVVDSQAGGSRITIKGRVRIGQMGSEDGMEIENRGQRGSLYRKSFTELDALLSKFPADSLRYVME